MNIFEVLDYEHRVIAQAMQLAQSFALRLAQPGATTEPLGQELSNFCSKFISQCHQVKEFNLFIRLLQKGRSYVIAPVTGLHAEHSRLVQLTASLDAAWRCAQDGQAGARELMAGYLTEYATLMQEHLVKEDRFYKLTSSILETADLEDLKSGFEQLDHDTLGKHGHAHYCAWAEQQAGAAS